MNNLKTTIQNNLYLRVDFNYSFKTPAGILGKRTRFFLIGVLPVFIVYKDGKKERAGLNCHIEVGQDPALRNLQGRRAGDFLGDGRYKKPIEKIVGKLEVSLMKIVRSKSFNRKPVTDINIINLESKCQKKRK
ncbi:MAG: hypothetical protein V1867_00930 [Candidatus Falkowbacteria bacterium]